MSLSLCVRACTCTVLYHQRWETGGQTGKAPVFSVLYVFPWINTATEDTVSCSFYNSSGYGTPHWRQLHIGICLGEKNCQETRHLTGALDPGVPAIGAYFQQVPVGLEHPPSAAINTLPSLVKEKTHSPKVMPFLDKKMSHIHQVLPPRVTMFRARR